MSRLNHITLLGVLTLLSISSCKKKSTIHTPVIVATQEVKTEPLQTPVHVTTPSYHYKPAPIKKQVPLYWDWDKIDTTMINFPSNFLWELAPRHIK